MIDQGELHVWRPAFGLYLTQTLALAQTLNLPLPLPLPLTPCCTSPTRGLHTKRGDTQCL